MTLVEMLVVMTIIGLLAGIAIPVFARSGAQAKNEVSGAARTLYSELVAARYHAARYRVDTAVVYALDKKQDSWDGTDQVFIAATATARLMTPEEYSLIEATFSDPAKVEKDCLFVLLNDHHGQFGFLGEYAGVAYDPTLGGTVDEETTVPDVEGLLKIRLYELDSDGTLALVRPVTPDGETDPLFFGGYASNTDEDLYENFRFPGHVFQPNGMIRTDASKQRFVLDVAATPNALITDRFMYEPGEYATFPDGSAVPPEGVLQAPKRIELYKSTGRVKINT
jgi:prepilin-type N-terminal cleavage/methylation domain-containing protein